MAFESIRRELKNEFFEYDYEADTENAFREVIFYKLSSMLTSMMSFGVSKDDTKELVVKFCESHELRQDQRISLISRIANYGIWIIVNLETPEQGIEREQENIKQQEEEQDESGFKKARKGIPDWLQKIESIQNSRTLEIQPRDENFGLLGNRKEEILTQSGMAWMINIESKNIPDTPPGDSGEKEEKKLSLAQNPPQKTEIPITGDASGETIPSDGAPEKALVGEAPLPTTESSPVVEKVD